MGCGLSLTCVLSYGQRFFRHRQLGVHPSKVKEKKIKNFDYDDTKVYLSGLGDDDDDDDDDEDGMEIVD